MSKVNPPKDLGVPVPSPALAAGTHLVLYYGPKGFTPSYKPSTTNTGRVDCGDVSSLSTKTVTDATTGTSTTYFDDPLGSELPQGFASGTYDFYFTFMGSTGNESNFSAPVTVAIDESIPPTPGQPVVLG